MDKKHKRILISLRTIGFIFLIAGLALFIFGMVDFFSHFDSESMPQHPWALFVAMPLLFVGLVSLSIGFRSKMMKFMAKDSQKVTGQVAQNISANLQKGSQGIKVCPKCGHINNIGDKFCEECGNTLQRKICPNCGESVDHYSRYCPTCGHEMDK